MTTIIPEHHRRLGRNVDHDERSRAFPARTATLVTTLHRRQCQPFDQGNLGSCTGNAMAGALMTTPLRKRRWTLGEADAVKLYEAATRLDDAPGSYPPDDTGSSGLAVAKAAKNAGYITTYRHAFGLQAALGALVLGPVIVGVNWYSSFDVPGAHGLVKITKGAQVRGGHEFELVGLDVTAHTVRAVNSWGTAWGDQGYFTFSWGTLNRLLNEQGDVTQFVV